MVILQLGASRSQFWCSRSAGVVLAATKQPSSSPRRRCEIIRKITTLGSPINRRNKHRPPKPLTHFPKQDPHQLRVVRWKSSSSVPLSSKSSSSSSAALLQSQPQQLESPEEAVVVGATTRSCSITSESVPLGTTLPTNNKHACSVSLPTWKDVVGYLENDPTTTAEIMKSGGYPRFCYHPYVQQLMQLVLKRYSSIQNDVEEDCLLLPTLDAAKRCQTFLRLQQQAQDSSSTNNNSSDFPSIRIVPITEADVYAVLFPNEPDLVTQAKAYWQHTGDIVSSRRAEAALNILEADKGAENEAKVEKPSSSTSTTSTRCHYEQLQNRIATWTNIPQDHVFLTSSGMSAIYQTLRTAQRRHNNNIMTKRYDDGTDDGETRGGKSIVFGFPYLDTLKLCSRSEFCNDGVEFFGCGDANDLQLLEQTLEENARKNNRPTFSVLFTEVPSNPLLQTPDLYRLRQLANKNDFCLIVDDTIGNFLNLDLLESQLADAVCTSLTKVVSGVGDTMAGSIITNPYTSKGRELKQFIKKKNQEQGSDVNGGLHMLDAEVLLQNSSDFVERNMKINETAELVADYFKDHPDIENVWYPKFTASSASSSETPLYSSYMRAEGGYGGLMSIQLKDHMCPQAFYDKLNIPKGPSLGTNFTLVCPYTLLAHYNELGFAMKYNVPSDLIRISVGLEDFDELREKFECALNSSSGTKHNNSVMCNDLIN